jgi:hypothetical protein
MAPLCTALVSEDSKASSTAALASCHWTRWEASSGSAAASPRHAASAPASPSTVAARNERMALAPACWAAALGRVA